MKKGFTLMELMTAAVVVAIGAILIYECFFRSLDLFNYCYDYLGVVSWVDEKIWKARDDIIRTGTLSEPETAGTFKIKNKNFGWNLYCSPAGDIKDLYRLNLSLFWKEGSRPAVISRNVFARYEREKK